MDADKHRYNEITEKVIGCAFKVHNELGPGFLEKVYENALAYEIKKSGLLVEQQKEVFVFYDKKIVGEYVCDLLVESIILIELKATKGLDDVHLAQCLNYLKATGYKLCLLMNFGTTKVQIKRIVKNL
ncbi:MAG TPA: GxxExxY protein [Bacteroidetes bacterium]|nr:GxxExxY protein [Bacteroidota bacterium]